MSKNLNLSMCYEVPFATLPEAEAARTLIEHSPLQCDASIEYLDASGDAEELWVVQVWCGARTPREMVEITRKLAKLL